MKKKEIPILLVCKNCGEQFNVIRQEGNMPVNAFRLESSSCPLCMPEVKPRRYYVDKEGKEICDE